MSSEGGRPLSGADGAITFINRGNHNIGFDRYNNFGVASSPFSHIGSSSFFFLHLSRVGARCTQVPRGGAFGGVVVFEAGACGPTQGQLYSARPFDADHEIGGR